MNIMFDFRLHIINEKLLPNDSAIPKTSDDQKEEDEAFFS